MYNSILSDCSRNANEIFVPLQSREIFIVYNEKSNWDLIDDYQEAFKMDAYCSLASINDLHDYVAAGGEVFEGIVKDKEGLYKWFELSITAEDMLEDHFCEYRLVEEKV
ncbi:hypothetical protein [Brevibacillus laterosporus]|uniref:hypothetical protein n=1 Tax=Brevibacillus laterosporus TaxID=1465 RepID=UPI001EF25909|nr:hypothetical protein [Brevibacillus laterosporus]MCG7317665.1 hypothetical protein [Brevibacillus laterosporus]